jgi:VCBS repeat-containing protein
MTVVVNLTGNDDIDGVLWGWAWGDGGTETLNFSFPTSTAEYTDNGYSSITGFNAFNAAQQTAVRAALANVASFTNLVFVETTDTFATLRYAEASAIVYTTDSDVASHMQTNPLNTAEANPPELGFGGDPPFSAPYAQGDSWYNPSNYNNPTLGSYQDTAGIMHETGHNLGLKHGHVTQDAHGDTFPALPADHDSQEYSVMTYRQFPGNPIQPFNNPDFPTTYMQDDIAALQYMYGANYGASANNTDTVYTWSKTTGAESINGVAQAAPYHNFVFMTLWDGGGTDTYDFSNYTTELSVDLNPGEWIVLDTSSSHFQRADLGNDGAGGAEYFARGNIANALVDPNDPSEITSFIENAIGGTGDDEFVGNSVGNVLTGGGGDDEIDGAGGSDTAVYSGARSEYLTTDLGGGSVRIADQRSGTPDGTDEDSNVEFFQFSNRTYTLAEVVNQPPVLSPDSGSPHALTELPGTTNSGTADSVSGSLGFTDEASDTHTASDVLNSATWSGGAIVPAVTLAALSGAMSTSIGVDGSPGTLDWDFSLADRRVDFLAAGETLTVVYDVTVLDQLLNSSTVPVTIEFTGMNDAPRVVGGSSVLTGSIVELPLVTGSPATDSASGVIAFADVDLNDRPTATIGTQSVTWQDATHDYTSELSASQIAGFRAALTIAAEVSNTNNGSIDWTYDIVDSELDFLAVGESITITSQVTIDDHNGGTVSPDVVVTLVGSNDAPVAIADSNGTAKNSTLSVSAAAGVLSNDFDPDVHDNDDLFVSQVEGSAANVGVAIAGTYGKLTLNADGSYSYAADKGNLPPKVVAQDTFDYTLSDGHGGTDTTTLSIVVFNPGAQYQSGIDTTLVGGNGPDVLDGSYGGDTLLGGNGPDVLIGGPGDTLTGGNGPDTFLFRPDFGTSTVVDFDVHTDAIQFDASMFANTADILAHTTDSVAGALITAAAGDTLTLSGVTAASLAAHPGVFMLA